MQYGWCYLLFIFSHSSSFVKSTKTSSGLGRERSFRISRFSQSLYDQFANWIVCVSAIVNGRLLCARASYLPLDWIGGYGGGGFIQVWSGRLMCRRSDENSAKYCSAGITRKNLYTLHAMPNVNKLVIEKNKCVCDKYWKFIEQLIHSPMVFGSKCQIGSKRFGHILMEICWEW